MDNNQSVAHKALSNLKAILANTSADVVGSLPEAREVHQALDQIFREKGFFEVENLIEAINVSSKEIIEFCTNQRVDGAVTTQADWEKDIQIGNAYHDREKVVRRTFAQRGLTEHYRRWRMKYYKRDIIADLLKKSSSRTKKIGTFEEFLETHNIEGNWAIHKGHKHGIKMLLVERLVGEPTIPVILNFSYDRFSEVSRSDLRVLCKVVHKTEWMMSLVAQLVDWVKACQARYDASSKLSTHFGTLCKPDYPEERDHPDDTITTSDHSQSHPPKKRRKHQVAGHEIVEASLLDTVSETGRLSDIEHVQASYRKAHKFWSLMNNRIPTSFRLPDDLWDPYVLQTQEDMLKAILDEDAVKKVQKQVTDITNDLPKSKIWDDITTRRRLAIADIKELIQISIGESGTQSTSLGSSIADIIDIFHQRATSLGSDKLKNKRAKRITFFIKHSLMRVQEFLDRRDGSSITLFPKASKFAAYCHKMFGEIAWGPREIPLFLQLNSRKLQRGFGMSCPAFYGELVHTFCATEFSEKPLTAQSTVVIPTFLEVLKRVLGDRVNEKQLRDALGYPDTPFNGLQCSIRPKRCRQNTENGTTEHLIPEHEEWADHSLDCVTSTLPNVDAVKQPPTSQTFTRQPTLSSDFTTDASSWKVQPNRSTAQHLTSKSNIKDKENEENKRRKNHEEDLTDNEETSDEDTKSATSVYTSLDTLDQIVSPPQEDPTSAEVGDGQQIANDWPVYPQLITSKMVNPWTNANNTSPFNSQVASIAHQQNEQQVEGLNLIPTTDSFQGPSISLHNNDIGLGQLCNGAGFNRNTTNRIENPSASHNLLKHNIWNYDFQGNVATDRAIWHNAWEQYPMSNATQAHPTRHNVWEQYPQAHPTRHVWEQYQMNNATQARPKHNVWDFYPETAGYPAQCNGWNEPFLGATPDPLVYDTTQPSAPSLSG